MFALIAQATPTPAPPPRGREREAAYRAELLGEACLKVVLDSGFGETGGRSLGIRRGDGGCGVRERVDQIGKGSRDLMGTDKKHIVMFGFGDEKLLDRG